MASGSGDGVLLVTTDGVAGCEIVDVLGLVAGFSSDREQALGVLADQARDLGADAVVAVRIDSTASGGAFISNDEAFAYGTAVRTRAPR